MGRRDILPRLPAILDPVVCHPQGVVMNMKAMLGAVLAFALAVGGAALLVANFAKPTPPPPPAPQPETKKEDTLSTNPFDLTAPGPKSKVAVDAKEYDFVVMQLGTEESHEFVFTNEGEAPLQLAKGPMMCKCTIPSVPDQQIQPGESVKIKLTWKPVETTKHFSKTATIWTNDPANPEITLSINGRVTDDPVVTPSDYSLREIAWNKEHVGEVHLLSSTSTDLKIETIEVSHPEWMSVTSVPADLASLIQQQITDSDPDFKPQSGLTIKLTIKPNGSVGLFNGWVKVKTNLNPEPRKIDVVGLRTGPISIHGGDFQASRSMIDLKRFKSGDGKSVRLFLALEPFGQDLQFLDVISESKNLTVALQKQPTSEGEKRDRYILLIQAAPGIIPGTNFTYEHPDSLILKTNHPGAPDIPLNVRYVVH
jgi:Protein of unknown function (DUF1573)